MKKPKIRFKGFTETWEQRKLGDLTKELSDYATMASGLPLLTSSRGGLMYQSYFRDRKTTTSDETLFSIVPKGSCTYRHMSDDDIFHFNINVLEKGLVSREYPVFISSENNDLEFIIQYINSSDRFRAFCKGQKKGGTRTRLYYKTLCEFEMMIPSIEEQKKISATLHKLDHLITLHQRKCENLKKLKKFMLQKLFPQNGENVPKIRFTNFTDTWEQRKLSEIALQTYGGGTPKTANEEFWKGNIPWIQSSDLIEERLFNVKPRKYISQEAISKSSTKLVPQNSITIVTRVGVGKLAFMPFSYATSQDFLSLSELKIEPKFAVYALYKMMRLVSNEVQGTSIKGITKDELLAKEILIPDCEVQKKIGAYLHNLDNLITLHQSKCDNLKEVKKYMLQNMFI